jgi:hypothetical protein
MINEKLLKDLDVAFTNFGDTKQGGFVEVVPTDTFAEVTLTFKDDADLEYYEGSIVSVFCLHIESPTVFEVKYWAHDYTGETYAIMLNQDDIRFIALINSILRSYEV